MVRSVKSEQDRCKRQTTLSLLPPSSSASPAPLGCVPWTLGSSCGSGWHCCTAFYHQIKNSVSYQELPSSLSTPTSLGALWQTGRNVFLQPLSHSFICNNVLGNQVWTIFIAQMPARRSSSLCSSALWIAHMWKQRAQGTAKTKAPV